MKVYQIPQAVRTARGKTIVSLLKLQDGEKINATITIKDFNKDEFLIMVTEKGIIKKTSIAQFGNIRSNGIRAINLDENDKLIKVQLTNGEDNVFIGTRKGKAIHFKESDVRHIQRAGRGVKAIQLVDDIVVGMEITAKDQENDKILTVTENGYGKRTKIEEYRLQRRSGKGIINIKVTDKTGPVVGIKKVKEDEDVMAVTSDGILIRTSINQISVIGRNTQGVRIIDTKGERKVIAIATLDSMEEENESEEEGIESNTVEE